MESIELKEMADRDHASKPTFRTKLENIHAELQQFMCCKFEWKDGKWAKMPFWYRFVGPNCFTQKGGHKRPETRMTLERVAALIRLTQSWGRHFVGPQLIITDDCLHTCIDLDGCRDPITGELAAWAAEIAAMFPGAYKEVSNSGTGVHIIIRGKVRGNPQNKKNVTDTAGNVVGGIEIYSGHNKLILLTGDLIGEPVENIADGQAALDILHAREFPYNTTEAIAEQERLAAESRAKRVYSDVRSTLDDHEILERIKSSANGVKFAALFEAPGDPSRLSEEDLSLAKMFAFWCGPDADRIERLMMQSARNRTKWHTHKSYLENTIKKAIAGCRSFFGDGTYKAAGDDDKFCASPDVLAIVFGMPAPPSKPAAGEATASMKVFDTPAQSPAPFPEPNAPRKNSLADQKRFDHAYALGDAAEPNTIFETPAEITARKAARKAARNSVICRTPSCPRKRWIGMANYADWEFQHCATRCLCLGCETCEPIYRHDWKEKFSFAAYHIPETTWEMRTDKNGRDYSARVRTRWLKHQPIYAGTLPTNNTRNIFKRISNREGVHGSLPDGEDRTWVVSSVPDRELTPISPEEVRRISADLIDKLEAGGRGPNMSSLWKEEREKSGWELVCGNDAKITPVEMERAVIENGQEPKTKTRPRGGLSHTIRFKAPMNDRYNPAFTSSEEFFELGYKLFKEHEMRAWGGIPLDEGSELPSFLLSP